MIVVRMTFPANENIQGLRAYTPTDEGDLKSLADIEDILPPNASVERIPAISREFLEKPIVKRQPKHPYKVDRIAYINMKGMQ